MIARYEDLTPDALAALGFDDPAQACRHLQEMAGHDVPDRLFDAALRALMPALADCADPDRAAANLRRWADTAGSRTAAYQLIAENPLAARILVTVLAASQFFADLLIRDPEYLEALLNPTLRARPRDPKALWADLSRRVGIAKTPNAQRDALRRCKGPEMLRIGVRDLLGDADMPTVAREISDFADAAVQMALQICKNERPDAPPAFAVIAMGKLGGRELNYSSDIDLILVHGDDADAAACIKLAEAVRDTLARTTDAGYVFRVDLRLRPEGRFGPVSRSLSSCRAYYESWAEPWERQALIKARAIAGEAELGAAFVAMTQEFVYGGRTEESVVDSIRQNKRRLEQKIAHAGEADINVKEGVGGIRDIEFPVQLMQLLAGGRHPSVRTGNTLEALGKLAAIGLISGDERATMHESYLFLRTVEHRLQLLDDRAVRTLPRNPGALDKLGRILRYADGAAFMQDYRAQTRRVHRLFERLFYQQGTADAPASPSDDMAQWTLATDDSAAQDALRAALQAREFRDVDAALATLRQAVVGTQYGAILPEERLGFAALAGPLLDACAQTVQPDAALSGLSALADAVPSRTALYQLLSDSPALLTRFARLAAESGFLWQTLLSHLEFLDLLADEEAMDAPPPAFPPVPLPRPELARQALRGRLQIGARDIWNLADTAQVGAELTQRAEGILSAALTLAQEEVGDNGPVAIIGLGKLGGSELGYSSDWDVLYVGQTGQLAAAARTAERLQQILNHDLARYGVRCEVDARLRPEGRAGALVLDRESYRDYYAHRAATWERQALLKARPVAGDAALGQEFARLQETVVYGRAVTETQMSEIRAMKRRIETERVKTPHDLKLGPGGMSDIEWTVQMLQLRFGPARPRLRRTGTLAALRALRDDARITQADWETLDGAYRQFTRLRNRLYLQNGVGTDAPAHLPPDAAAAMSAVRPLCLRLFYGEG